MVVALLFALTVGGGCTGTDDDADALGAKGGGEGGREDDEDDDCRCRFNKASSLGQKYDIVPSKAA